jgi:hypothetical protein
LKHYFIANSYLIIRELVEIKNPVKKSFLRPNWVFKCFEFEWRWPQQKCVLIIIVSLRGKSWKEYLLQKPTSWISIRCTFLKSVVHQSITYYPYLCALRHFICLKIKMLRWSAFCVVFCCSTLRLWGWANFVLGNQSSKLMELTPVIFFLLPTVKNTLLYIFSWKNLLI